MLNGLFIGLSIAFIIFSAIVVYHFLKLSNGIKKAIYISAWQANVIVILYQHKAHADATRPTVIINGMERNCYGQILFGTIALVVAQTGKDRPSDVSVKQCLDPKIYGKERPEPIIIRSKDIYCISDTPKTIIIEGTDTIQVS